MTCRELVEAMLDYVAGDLPAGARAEADLHFDGCADCREYLASYRATVALAKAAADGDAEVLPEPVVDELLARRPKR